MQTIQLHDKHFAPYIDATTIEARIIALAQQIDLDYAQERPLFIGILNGSFLFAADLFRHLKIEAEISFIKLFDFSCFHSH